MNIIYEIDEKLIVDANEGEYVLYDRGDDRITLTTLSSKIFCTSEISYFWKTF